jgi:hypothetical protein
VRNSWAGRVAVMAICISLMVPTQASQAASSEVVRVTLPSFQVSLNGHHVDNLNRENPLLVYKDITYVPMTWYDSRLLGLEAAWSPENGLNIAQQQVSSSFVAYQADRRNAAAFNAEILTTSVTINGKPIDNSKEPYPLLSFRDVTYFPLTWKFAHDEFGWDYRWDEAEGLSIRSSNPQIRVPELPAYVGKNDVAMYKGYYYFAEMAKSSIRVKRAAVQHPTDLESVYSYDIPQGIDTVKPYVQFRILDHELWFTYRLGSNLMGTNTYVKVNADGKGEVIKEGGFTDFKKTSYGILAISLGPNYWSGNLSLVAPGPEDSGRLAVGDSNLVYGRYVEREHSSFPVTGIGNGDSAEVRGDYIYIRASAESSEEINDLNQIYYIDLRTNETRKIVDVEVSQFRIFGERLYYVKAADHVLYSSELDGTDERRLSEHTVSWFDGVGGSVYYTSAINKNKYLLYQAHPDGEDALVLQEQLSKVQAHNGKLICLLDENRDYGAIVLDGSGRKLLAVAESISQLLPSDDAILFKAGDSTIKVIR